MELDDLKKTKIPPNLLYLADLGKTEDRTLLLGETDGITSHLYIFDCNIYFFSYTGTCIFSNLVQILYKRVKNINIDNEDLFPALLYPCCCDFNFCKTLKQRGVHLSFAPYEEMIRMGSYYGVFK